MVTNNEEKVTIIHCVSFCPKCSSDLYFIHGECFCKAKEYDWHCDCDCECRNY
ncbi:MAG: hypothetical protein ACOC2W_01135 [bacterium]